MRIRSHPLTTDTSTGSQKDAYKLIKRAEQIIVEKAFPFDRGGRAETTETRRQAGQGTARLPTVTRSRLGATRCLRFRSGSTPLTPLPLPRPRESVPSSVPSSSFLPHFSTLTKTRLLTYTFLYAYSGTTAFLYPRRVSNMAYAPARRCHRAFRQACSNTAR